MVVAALLMAFAGYSLWSWAAHHQFPWESLPDRVHACGRDFDHAPDSAATGPFTRAQITHENLRKVDSWGNFRGHFEVWAGPPCGGRGDVTTPTGVYVRTPSGEFFGFALSGGP
ncbi:MAG: hypothetical protein NVSMB48_12070 [Marmoricola sp.]